MEEDGDDFGDLYVGVNDQVYSGISSTDATPVFGGEDAEKNTWPASDPPHEDKDSPSGRPCEDREGVAIEEDIEEMEEAEEDDDNGSDSEDDIHIVLNDDDCARFGAGETDREIGDGAERGEKGRWIGAGKLQSVGDRAEQGERGLYGMAGGCSHPSQMKGFGHFSSPRTGKRERDVSSMSEVAESYFTSTAACNLRGMSVVRNGFDFFLPRSRTIFDVNMEAFEWKPWRSHGAVVTDYFNFGMNEDTWKSYCGSVDDFRKQNMLPNAFGATKAFEYEQSHGAVSCDSPPVQVGGAVSAFERPIGKAIQVEGGAGERMPSMETKRFRNRDSDVVIQIKMEDTLEDTSGLANFGLTSDSLDVKSKDNILGSVAVDVKTDILLSEQGQERNMATVNNADQHCLHCTKKKSDSTSEKSRGQLGSDMKDNCNRPSTENAISNSLIGVDVGCDLNPSFLDSEESLNDVSSDEVRSPGKSSSLDSVSGSPDSVISDKCVYDDSRDGNKRPSLVIGKCSTSYKYDRTRHNIKEKLSVDSHVYSVEDNEEAAYHAQRKGKKDSNHFKTSSDKQQRNCNRSSFSGNEIEASVSHRDKYSSKDKECIQRNCLVKGDWGHCRRGKCNRSYSPRGRSSRYHHGPHLKRFSLEKEHDDMERRNAVSALHKKNKKLGAVKAPTYLKEDWHLYQRRKRFRGQDIGMEVEQEYDIEYDHIEDVIHEWHDNSILYYEHDREIRGKYHIDEGHHIHPVREEKLNYLSRIDSEVDIDYRRWNGHRSRESRVRPLSIEREIFDILPDSSSVHSSRKLRQRQWGRWKASAFFDTASEKQAERAEDSGFHAENDLRYDSLYHYRWLPDEVTTIRCREHDDFYFPDLPFRGSPENEEYGSMHLSTSGRHSDNIYPENSRNKNNFEESAYYETRKLNNTFRGGELVGRPTDRQERKSRRDSKAGRASGKRKVTKVTEEPHLDVAVGNKRKEPGSHYPDELIDQRDMPHDPVIHCNPYLKESCVEIAVQEPDGSELEEGQLVEELEDKDVSSVLNTNSPVNQVPSNFRRNFKGRTQNYTGKSPDNVETIESNRLLEAMEKMQKRSERFKEPVSGKKDQQPDPEKPELLLQFDPTTITDEMKQRPARKRRWGGS